ncbi:MAG: 23S rRNA (guanosine(2251)-2'-O)-methyltransferase RlmB [Gammaproteobacteria bacterium]|nr:23S rRNA (guanosine(2251)-2'-O)-methyltransferase RlmB [Gammaproteobacteria bacterium]
MVDEADYVYGIHAVAALVDKGADRIHRLYHTEIEKHVRRARVVQAAKAAGVVVQQVQRHELDARLPGAKHQGLLAEATASSPTSFSELILRLNADPDAFVLVLDGVQDPGNLGACLRSAAAAGVDAVIVPKDRASDLTGAARRSASGAAELVPVVQVPNLARALRALQAAGLTVVGADGGATTSLPRADLRRPLALVAGSEGQGLRHLTAEHCDVLVKIPLPGALTTLNVSVAVGILLYEACRDLEVAGPTVASAATSP